MVAEGRKDVCMKAIRKIGVCVCLCGLVATAFAAKLSKSVPRGWNEDFAASCETAKKEGKLLLLAFSGSDWCGWCVKMEREIYSDRKFITEAKKKFVLVMIDSPQNQDILSKLAKKQNPELVKKYGIRGYPSTIIARPDGEEVKRFGGYQRGGIEAFLKALNEVADAANPAKDAADEKSKNAVQKN